MTPHAHGGLLVVMVAFALGAMAGNVALLTLRGLVRARARRLSPRELSRLAAALLSAPALVGLTFVVATLLVPAAAWFVPELDHCTADTTAPHVCFLHGTWAFDSGWEALGVALLGGIAALTLGAELVALWRARRVALALLEGARPTTAVTWTSDEAPFAFAVGLLRPRVIASAGLKRVLTPAQLDAALAHERAHARRRHALSRATLRVLGSFTLPMLKRPLLALLLLGQEQEADEDAADEVRSRTLVAETLVRCLRASSSTVSPAAPALVGCAVEQRVESLCQPKRRGKSTGWLCLSLGALVVAVVAARAPLHGAAETVAGVLLSSPVHVHGDGHSSPTAE